jgi:serine/tyrosine/threonine adenylyltransferase
MYSDKPNIFNFDNSYLKLPSKFYNLVNPEPTASPKKLLINNDLLEELNIKAENQEELFSVLSGNFIPKNTTPFAQAYAGHQFGHFTMLGDGRAIMLGEHLTSDNRRFDIQLKGSGQTIYSRRGDGKATLKAMLREYLISEAMHYLKVPSSRSLAVIKTGETIYRESITEGAILARVMKSHIRVGTFEFARNFGTIDDLEALTAYTIDRLFPEIKNEKNPALALLEKVMQLQTDLVVEWMRVGFIHGVMNTDNVSISGETFDYGPCAFMNTYNPSTVFSSIDTVGRYAYGNQPQILKWNIFRFAEALLPVIHGDQEMGIKITQKALDNLETLWQTKYQAMLINKLGISQKQPQDIILAEELLKLMETNRLDYTNTFSALSLEIEMENNPLDDPALKEWLERWKNRIGYNEGGFQKAKSIMSNFNPVFISRNHLTEEALENAVLGDIRMFEKLLKVLKNPYKYDENLHSYILPPDSSFDNNFQTFCGT